MDESPMNVKYLLLVPTKFNDGADVPGSIFLELQDQLFANFDGWTVEGRVTGAYRMKDGSQAIDDSIVYWIVIRAGQEKTLRGLVAALAKKLGQESMFLERTGSTVDFVQATETPGDEI